MAKAKQKASSAAQRRDQQRQQRQQRFTESQKKQSPSRNRRAVARQSNRNTWFLVGGIVVLVAIIIGAFIILSRQQQSGSAATPVDPTIFKKVTQVDPNVWQVVGTGGVQNPVHGISGSPPLLKGPSGKPEFYYAGAEYCPFCAAERWSMVVALSRFGTFSHLSQIQSAEDNISTFTFYQSAYTGSYIDFVPLELNTNTTDSSGGYTTLQTPTADQQKLLDTYNGPPYFSSAGSIPFIDIGNRYLLQGSSYSPQVLLDSASQSLSWQDIASNLSDSNSQIGKDILGTANYLTAAICKLTNQQPGSVCNTSTIQSIEQSLPKTAVSAGGTEMRAASGPLEAAMRRLD